MALTSMLLCLHVLDSYVELRDDMLDSYVELRDDRRPVFAFFFASWPELKARVLTRLGTSGIAARGGF